MILAPITSRIAGGADEVVLDDWRSAGLARSSAVKPLLATFEATLIRRKLGRPAPADLAAVRALFGRILFGMPELRGRNLSFGDDDLIVELADGCTVTVPLAWFPRLFHATPAERANWRWIGGGIGMHWEEVDEDIAVTTLLRLY